MKRSAPPTLFPQELAPLRKASILAATLLSRLAMRVYHRLSIIGRENLPATNESFVMIANHASHLDGPALLAALPLSSAPDAHPMAASDYFFRQRGAARTAGRLFNAMPFDRETCCARPLAACRALLAERGQVLIIFPEGTRSADGRIASFKRGVGDLLAGSHVPALPCFIEGTFAAWPRSCYLPRPRRVRVWIGTRQTFAHLPRGKASALTIAAELQRAVEDLSRCAHQPKGLSS